MAVLSWIIYLVYKQMRKCWLWLSSWLPNALLPAARWSSSNLAANCIRPRFAESGSVWPASSAELASPLYLSLTIWALSGWCFPSWWWAHSQWLAASWHSNYPKRWTPNCRRHSRKVRISARISKVGRTPSSKYRGDYILCKLNSTYTYSPFDSIRYIRHLFVSTRIITKHSIMCAVLLPMKCLYFDPQDIAKVLKAPGQTPRSRESPADWGRSCEFWMRYYSRRTYWSLVMRFSNCASKYLVCLCLHV